VTAPVLTAAEFADIKQQLEDRRYSYLNRPVKQPLIRIHDKNMRQIARVMIPETWDCEEIAHDDGTAHIEIVGKDNDWLRDLIIYKTRPAEDLHITIDPDPDKPHDFKNRWGGKVETINDVRERGKATVTKISAIHNRRHLSKFNLAATPLLPPAVQPIKMFLWGGPCASTCATAMMINLARVYSFNAFWPLPRNILAPETWLENLSPLNWPVQVMPINPIFDQSRWCTIGARWKDAKTVLNPVMKDAGVICHAYTWLPGDPPPYADVFGNALGAILQPTRSCVILSFENDSGVTGFTGTAVDGLVNLFAATADDLITEALFPVDGDGDGETDPLIRKILGVAPKRPPYIYRDVGYGGPNRREMTIHKSQAVIIVTGGRSPQWVGAPLGNWRGTDPLGQTMSQSSDYLCNSLCHKPIGERHQPRPCRRNAGTRLRRSRQPLPRPARRHPARVHQLHRPDPLGRSRTVRLPGALRDRVRSRLHHQLRHDPARGLVEDKAVRQLQVRHRRRPVHHRRGTSHRNTLRRGRPGAPAHRSNPRHQTARHTDRIRAPGGVVR
jgi:hypothetical protein